MEGKIIPIWKNAYPRIILRRQKHLCKEKRSSKDYFAAAEASLQGETLSQGLFCGGRSISAKRKVHPGIILRRQKHLSKEKSSSRDALTLKKHPPWPQNHLRDEMEARGCQNFNMKSFKKLQYKKLEYKNFNHKSRSQMPEASPIIATDQRYFSLSDSSYFSSQYLQRYVAVFSSAR